MKLMHDYQQGGENCQARKAGKTLHDDKQLI